MHRNLRPPEPRQFFFRFGPNYDAMPSLTSLNLSIAVLERFATDTLLYARCDLDLWPCNLDLWFL